MKNLRGGGRSRKYSALVVDSCFFFLRHPCNLLCGCMSLCKIGAFLTGDQVHVFYEGNHSNSLLDSYINIGI